jgi:DNA-binding YbaB/EbfC family protein
MMDKKNSNAITINGRMEKKMGKYKGFKGAGMNTNTKMNSVISQAKKMQEEMEKVQAEMEEKVIEATAGGGVITVQVNGKKELLSVKIKPEVVDPDDIETLEDLIMVAVNDAISKADEMMSEGMNAITGGINIPGLF